MVAFTRGKRLDRRVLSPQMRAFFGEPIPTKKFYVMPMGGFSGNMPVLSNPTALFVGPTNVTLGVTTDTPTGFLYWVVTTSNVMPTAVQIQAGQDNLGHPAAASGNQPVAAIGVQTVIVTGLLITHTYTAFLVQVNANLKTSNIVATAPFTTAGPSLRFEFNTNSMYLGGPS